MQRIEPQEARAEMERGAACFLDVRSEAAYEQSDECIPGDVRIAPDRIEHEYAPLPRDRMLVAYCT